MVLRSSKGTKRNRIWSWRENARENVSDKENRKIQGKIVFITGANGDIGEALIAEMRNAGAAQIVAAIRGTSLTGQHIVPMMLDVTASNVVSTVAVRFASSVNILINNAGINGHRGILGSESGEFARREIEVNYFGTFNMVRAFAPAMQARAEEIIDNKLSFLAYMNLPAMGSYSASKAAAYSLTQCVRAELGSTGVRVCGVGVMSRLVDTRMSAFLGGEKLSTKGLVSGIIEAILLGVDDFDPGAAADAYTVYLRNPVAMERALGRRLAVSR